MSGSTGSFADVEGVRGAAEGLRAGDCAGDWSSAFLGGNFGGFDFCAVSVVLGAGVDSCRGAADGGIPPVSLTAPVKSLRGSKEGFRSGTSSVAVVAGKDALRGCVDGLRAGEGAGGSARLAAAVEDLLGARDDLRSGTAMLDLAAGVDVLEGT